MLNPSRPSEIKLHHLLGSLTRTSLMPQGPTGRSTMQTWTTLGSSWLPSIPRYERTGRSGNRSPPKPLRSHLVSVGKAPRQILALLFAVAQTTRPRSGNVGKPLQRSEAHQMLQLRSTVSHQIFQESHQLHGYYEAEVIPSRRNGVVPGL